MTPRISLLTVTFALLVVFRAIAADTKDIRFSFKYAAPVVFSHSTHLSRYNNNCKICHDAIFNIKDHRRFTMAEMEKSKSCGACHSGAKAFSVASEKECVLCHKGKVRNVTYKIAGAGETVFSHANHLSATKGACKSCHNGKVISGRKKAVTMLEMEKGRSCGACHNGKPVFSVTGNCDRCHKGLKPSNITFNLKGVAPASFSHALHTQSFNCKECHPKLFPYRAVTGKSTMNDMAKGKSCGACHNGTDTFPSSGDCNKCHKGYKPPVIRFKTEAGETLFSHEKHLEIYKCGDCHTKIFAYKAGARKTTMTEMEQGKSCGACHNKGKDGFPVQDDCGKCHKM